MPKKITMPNLHCSRLTLQDVCIIVSTFKCARFVTFPRWCHRLLHVGT